jgi:hypothetical protein
LVRAVVVSIALSSPDQLTLSDSKDVCSNYLRDSFSPKPDPPRALINGIYEPAAWPVKQKSRFPQAEAFSFSA